MKQVKSSKTAGIINTSFVADSDTSINEQEIDKITDEEASEKRATWSNQSEFLMSCISMSVGLGNIWRFPFTAYENGGGAFLIPYVSIIFTFMYSMDLIVRNFTLFQIIVLFLIGKPLYYMEMVLGQFTSRGAVHIWEALPLLKGIGIGQMFGTISVVTYYVSLIALTLVYLISSFASELPWSKCKDSWEEQCVDSSAKKSDVGFIGTNQSFSSSELFFV